MTDWKDIGNLYRVPRMKSFKINKVKGVKVTAYDSQGRDVTHCVKSSFVYDGVHGGFYLDTEKMKNN